MFCPALDVPVATRVLLDKFGNIKHIIAIANPVPVLGVVMFCHISSRVDFFTSKVTDV